MAETTGTVTCVRVTDDAAVMQLVDAAGIKEIFILWFDPPEVSAFERIMHSMWVALLRDALVSGLPVTVNHPNTSSRVRAVQLGAL